MKMLNSALSYTNILEFEHGRTVGHEGFSDDLMLNIFNVLYLKDGFRYVKVTLFHPSVHHLVVIAYPAFSFEAGDFKALGVQQKIYGTHLTDKEKTKIAQYASGLDTKCGFCKVRILTSAAIDGRTSTPPIPEYFCGDHCLEEYKDLYPPTSAQIIPKAVLGLSLPQNPGTDK